MERLRGLVDDCKGWPASLRQRWLPRSRGAREQLEVQQPDGKIRLRSPAQLSRTLARIIVWENRKLSVEYFIQFTILYWAFVYVWSMWNWTAAGSAALLALILESSMEPEDKARKPGTIYPEDMEPLPIREIDFSILRKERNLLKIIKLTFQRLKVVVDDHTRAGKDLFSIMLVCFIGIVMAFAIQYSFPHTFMVYNDCLCIFLLPAAVFSVPVEDFEYDSEMDDFVFSVTEDNVKVLDRAGEAGDHSPTPSSLDTSASNDMLELAPSFSSVGSTEDLDNFEKALTQKLRGNLICTDCGTNCHCSDSSSSSEDEEISLKPKKMNEVDVNADDDDDDDDFTSEDLNDFEIIEAEEIAGIKFKHNV